MRVRLQVIIESDAGEVEKTQEVACWQRTELRAETAGLTLDEAKATWGEIQKTMMEWQVKEFMDRHRCCPSCGTARARRGKHEIVYHTAFGELKLDSQRFARCPCEGKGKTTFSPLADLLAERTSPELLYLENKWMALIPFRAVGELLQDVLPLARPVSISVLRANLQKVAGRLEAELGEERHLLVTGRAEASAESSGEIQGPMLVGLDGGYVQGCEGQGRQEGWFEVIAGKSINASGGSKCFAYVHKYDQKPRRRLVELLKAQGLQTEQLITYLSDGGETVRNVQLYLDPMAEHVLDWFHITMKLTVMLNTAKGVEAKEPSIGRCASKELKSLKWHLWNGNVDPALRVVDGLQILLDGEDLRDERKNLLRMVREFGGYIASNQKFIPDYGERHRNEERIATGFVESAVNQVVSKRMVKKQQMRWSQQGAHLLLQIRTQVLNDDDLLRTFQRWYPGLKPTVKAKAA